MKTSSTVQSHIDITDTMARLYLFLAQSLDRCVSEAARISYPEPQSKPVSPRRDPRCWTCWR